MISHDTVTVLLWLALGAAFLAALGRRRGRLALLGWTCVAGGILLSPLLFVLAFIVWIAYERG